MPSRGCGNPTGSWLTVPGTNQTEPKGGPVENKEKQVLPNLVCKLEFMRACKHYVTIQIRAPNILYIDMYCGTMHIMGLCGHMWSLSVAGQENPMVWSMLSCLLKAGAGNENCCTTSMCKFCGGRWAQNLGFGRGLWRQVRNGPCTKKSTCVFASSFDRIVRERDHIILYTLYIALAPFTSAPQKGATRSWATSKRTIQSFKSFHPGSLRANISTMLSLTGSKKLK